MIHYGEKFELENDDKILEIKSPKNMVGGPYVVIYKDIKERWAIVAMDWDGKRRLGIRWFYGNKGYPNSRGNATWLVIPPNLTEIILAGLQLEHKFSGKIDEYLTGNITGEELKKYKKEKNL